MSQAAVRQQRAAACFEDYYANKGDDRNDPLRNPGVLFQNLAFEKSIVEALRKIQIDKEHWKFLDVGCGAGFSLLRLLSYGIEPERLHGIDIVETRVTRGQRRIPSLNLVHGDAAAMHYQTASFDLAMESTVFVQILDESTARAIAREMVRVIRPGGYIVLSDWRYGFPRSKYRGLSRRRIAELFAVGEQTEFVCQTKGALLPPLGRALSRYLPSLYFLLCAVLPVLVGQTTVVLRRR
ncbi:MAG: class I SAM-dependent methyltransferase [Bryobacteraceae bacterium]